MGDEVRAPTFSEADAKRFRAALEDETARLGRCFAAGGFDDAAYRVGFELEAWLIDLDCYPLPHNEAYLERIDTPYCLPELSRFNVEFNTDPVTVGAGMLPTLHAQLGSLWQHATEVGEAMDLKLGMIGILPTIQERDLTVDSMSRMNRYQALNERVMELRKRRPLQIDIRGRDRLYGLHEDVMLESACTSFQIHLQVPQSKAVRAYNASLALQAATAAISGNAPFLFGMDLWDETRVPLFEQAVCLDGMAARGGERIGRVSCGSGYARESLFEFFQENLRAFPVILPQPFDADREELRHLKLHNGTIWRWTRPLIGGEPDARALRIEHRVMSAGPTEIDMIANLAFFVGCMMAELEAGGALPAALPFAVAQENFYNCAREGLDARVRWSGGQERPIDELLLGTLLPQARRGLAAAGAEAAEIDRYLGVVADRVECKGTGSSWMRSRRRACQGDLRALVGTYLRNQQQGRPVHLWPL